MTVEPLSDGETIMLGNILIMLKEPLQLSCEYTNWRGETSVRTFRPVEIWFGMEFRPEPGLMLKAFDLDKQAERDFRLTDFNLATLRKVDG